MVKTLSKPRPHSRWRGLLRVQGYLLGCAALALLPRARGAPVQASEQLSDWSRTVAQQLGLEPGTHQVVTVNGEVFHFALSVRSDPPDRVVSEAQRVCREQSGDAGAFMKGLLSQVGGPKLSQTELEEVTSLRRGAEPGQSYGEIGCLVRHDAHSEDGRAFQARLERFAKTLQFGELGEARYVRAERMNGSSLTTVLAVWTNSQLDLLRMLASDGDAPGSDPVDFPRPPKSTRHFSAIAAETTDGAYTYVSSDSPEIVADFYDRELPRHGWQAIHFTDSKEEKNSRAFSRDDRAAYLSVVDSNEGPGSEIGLAVLASRGSSGALVRARKSHEAR